MKRLFCAMVLLAVTATAGSFASNFLFLDAAPIRNFTEADMHMFQSAVWDALDNSADGTITAWRNPETNASGRLKPLKTYQAQGTTCRRLQIANKAGDLNSNVAFNFCRQPDNSWQVVD
jgi:surface antigen